MTLKQRRFLLVVTLLWVIAFLFIPIRNDVLSAYFDGNSPDTLHIRTTNQIESGSLLHFNGHPAGIVGILFFLLMPFFLVWQSFSIRRPFAIPIRTFLQLQALLLFLGAPYTYYIITYQHGVFSNMQHNTIMAWGGWLLCSQNVFLAVCLFWILASPESKPARFYDLDLGK
jgi:hypothetical protein